MDKELYDKIDNLIAIITNSNESHSKHLDELDDRISALEAMSTDQQKDRQTIRDAVTALEKLATEGQTTLKVLIWVGGIIASLVTLIITFGGYLPK